MTAVPADAPEAERERDARTRRDLTPEGCRALREATGPEPPPAFHRAAALVRPRLADWRARCERGARAATDATVRAATDATGSGWTASSGAMRATSPTPSYR